MRLKLILAGSALCFSLVGCNQLDDKEEAKTSTKDEQEQVVESNLNSGSNTKFDIDEDYSETVELAKEHNNEEQTVTKDTKPKITKEESFIRTEEELNELKQKDNKEIIKLTQSKSIPTEVEKVKDIKEMNNYLTKKYFAEVNVKEESSVGNPLVDKAMGTVIGYIAVGKKEDLNVYMNDVLTERLSKDKKYINSLTDMWSNTDLETLVENITFTDVKEDKVIVNVDIKHLIVTKSANYDFMDRIEKQKLTLRIEDKVFKVDEVEILDIKNI